MKQVFSIILPTYNRGYVLWRAIQSVPSQTETRWELLVVNDGSTDDTHRVLEEFHDPRIRTVTTSNGGPSSARNLGGQLTHAPYLAYLDSDNVWHPTFLATMLNSIQSHPDGVLWYCGQNTTIWQRETNGEWIMMKTEVTPRAQYSVEEALQILSPDTNCMVHTRSLLIEIGGWDEGCRWLEDWDFFTRSVIRYPNSVYWIPEVLVEYRQVYGPDADGLCATTVQDAEHNQKAWHYLVEKWKLHPDFAGTAQRLTAKYQLDSMNSEIILIR
jgi:glycosyltransferase involved in cell wall biosynthesis